ncbi:MAG: class I SAM-dependent methyltransferase [Deltaproteobacteria bacterium]|nr:class I SAM-dependent methyltransferase [Deltaproteobacteria bacterium]
MTETDRSPIELEETACLFCGPGETRPAASGYDYEYGVSDQHFCFVECRRCGHFFLKPRPRPSEAVRIYPQNYYTLEGRHTRWWLAEIKQRITANRLAFFTDRLDQGCDVFEVGCGDCSLLLGLQARFPRSTFAGIDLNLSATARKACRSKGIRLRQGSIEAAELEAGRYDLIIMNQLLEHLWEPVWVLKKLRVAMKSDGCLSIETPNLAGYDRRFFAQGIWGGYYFPRHLNLFSAESLGRLLQGCGFEIVLKKNLLAPIIWTFSLHARFAPSRAPSARARFFSDRNPICLGLFSAVDLLALLGGATTSNQKIIARKTG